MWIFCLWQELVQDTVQNCFLHISPNLASLDFRGEATVGALRNMSAREYKMKIISPNQFDPLKYSKIGSSDEVLMNSHCKWMFFSRHRRHASFLPKAHLALRGGWGIKNDHYYEILGLQRVEFPSDAAIKKAYHKAALAWHPDRNRKQPGLSHFRRHALDTRSSSAESRSRGSTGHRQDEADRRFKEIQHAYEVLSDPVRRREYDR
jgi:hypothetical protein